MSARKKQFRDKDVIFREGDRATQAFDILSGKVELIRDADNEEKASRVGLLAKGDVLGADDVASGTHQATAVASGRVSVRTLDQERMTELQQKSSGGWLKKLLMGSAPPRPKRAKRGGWFGASKKPDDSVIEIRVSSLDGEHDPTIDRLIDILAEDAAFSVDVTKDPVIPPKNPDPAQRSALLAWTAREALMKEQADLLILSTAGQNGTTLTLKMFPIGAGDDDLPGALPAGQTVTVPANLDEPFSGLTRAVAALATVPLTEAKRKTRGTILSAAVENVTDALKTKSRELLAEHQAGHKILFACMLAQVAIFKGKQDVYQSASDVFEDGLKALGDNDGPQDRALAQRHLAGLLQLTAPTPDGEEDEDPQAAAAAPLERAAELLEAALTGYPRATHPMAWAAIQTRLGHVYARLDSRDGDPELLKQSLSHYQAALQVYTRADHGLKWAEVMNNIGQTATILGETIGSVEILEKAAEACRNALGIRRKREYPVLWAASQNNLGSAQFMLGKITGDDDRLEAARESFELARNVYEGRGAKRMVWITNRNLTRVDALIEKRRPKGPPALPWEPREYARPQNSTADKDEASAGPDGTGAPAAGPQISHPTHPTARPAPRADKAAF